MTPSKLLPQEAWNRHLRQDKSKTGTKARVKRAGGDKDFLLKVLAN